MEIRVDDLHSKQVQGLLGEHLDDMARYSPPESVHALDVGALRAPEVTFWTAWDIHIQPAHETLMGCAALQALNDQHGEVKSMRTSKAYLRQGVARRLLLHLIAEGRTRDYRRLSLETGSADNFAPARAMYRSLGFTYCDPFADYGKDPYSVFMTLVL